MKRGTNSQTPHDGAAQHATLGVTCARLLHGSVGCLLLNERGRAQTIFNFWLISAFECANGMMADHARYTASRILALDKK